MAELTKLATELTYQTSRSGGKGGQSVNKIESKVELRFDIANSKVLTEEEKLLLLSKLKNKINADSVLVLYHQTERSQLTNKDLVTKKFYRLITRSLTKETPRKTTKPTLTSIMRKRESKIKRATLKVNRKKPDLD